MGGYMQSKQQYAPQQRTNYSNNGPSEQFGGQGRGARSSYTHFNQDSYNGGFDLGGLGGPVQGGTRGFGTGELKSYGYMGPPPQL